MKSCMWLDEKLCNRTESESVNQVFEFLLLFYTNADLELATILNIDKKLKKLFHFTKLSIAGLKEKTMSETPYGRAQVQARAGSAAWDAIKSEIESIVLAFHWVLSYHPEIYVIPNRGCLASG